MQGHTEGSPEVVYHDEPRHLVSACLPFQPPTVGTRASSAAPPGRTEVHPTTFFWVLFFFHLYPWCSCFKISLEQNVKGVVISFLFSSLPCKLPPVPHHTYAHTCKCAHTVVSGHPRMAARVEGLWPWSEVGQTELGRNGRQSGKAGLIGSGP